MMMRARHYSTLNRCIAKSVGHAVNNHYRNNNNKSSKVNDTNNKCDEISLYIGFTVVGILILLGIICPTFGLLELIVFCLIMLFK